MAAGQLSRRGRRAHLRARLGKAADRRHPGFLYRHGFYTVLLPALAGATKQVANESWVLGARAELAPDGAEALRLERDVVALYEADYAKQWDAMLADLNLVPLRSPEQAMRELYVLASPQSPMRDLLASIVRQLTLSQPPSLSSGGAVAEAGKDAAKDMAVTAVERRMPQTTVRLQPLAQAAAAGIRVEPPGKRSTSATASCATMSGPRPAPQSSKPIRRWTRCASSWRDLPSPAQHRPARHRPSGGDDPTALLQGRGVERGRPGQSLARSDDRQLDRVAHRQHRRAGQKEL